MKEKKLCNNRWKRSVNNRSGPGQTGTQPAPVGHQKDCFIILKAAWEDFKAFRSDACW